MEEIDHCPHAQALELLVERVGEASERTQFIIATYSLALADRLQSDGIIYERERRLLPHPAMITEAARRFVIPAMATEAARRPVHEASDPREPTCLT